MQVETQLLSSLEKVFLDEKPAAPPLKYISALRGETVNFQLVFSQNFADRLFAAVRIEGLLAPLVTIREVAHVPSAFPVFVNRDDYYLRCSPGLFPDALMPFFGTAKIIYDQWRSLWVEFAVPRDAAAGVFPMEVILSNPDNRNEVYASRILEIEIIDAVLPEQTLIHTEWFHCDCLAVYYNVPVFGEEHWKLMKNYIKNAVRYGANMLLTPVFTPPLDTEIGGERPTVQLVDVSLENGRYTFGFQRLKRYLELAKACGMQYFEISHLFTQWGAKHAPKIIASENGEQKQIFGWKTAAESPDYISFLNRFLSELKSFLRSENLLNRCWFHISDEPGPADFESYSSAVRSVKETLADCKRLDALSDYRFYREGLVSCPVPSNDHIQPFLENNVPDLWTYYCCGQTVGVSNRLMSMPSARNRILGWQMFKFNIKGFLHWGYNFWFSQYSKKPLNPFIVTDADDSFPSGDAFLVYPGEDGSPIPSIRQLVFFEGLQDLRALELLQSFIGRDGLLKWLDDECAEPLTFNVYPTTASWLLEMREKINMKIKDSCRLIAEES